jgi:hypothetical protein
MIMNEYQECIVQAIKQLVQSDGVLIETQPKEECINHRLALYLEQVLRKKNLLDGCCVDIEYDKYQADKKKMANGQHIRPDIIVHERKSANKNNLIVIEAKKGNSSEHDKSKVTYLVDNSNYRYSVGALVSYFPEEDYLEIAFLTQEDGWQQYSFDKRALRLQKTKK